MKTLITVAMLLTLALIPLGGRALAAGPMDSPGMPGPGAGMGHGPGAGMGPGTGMPGGDYSYILSGTPFTYSGTVASVNYYTGGGLVLATDGGSQSLYGLGPYWYWEQQGVTWPQVGDLLTARGYTVDIGDSQRNILMSITTAGGKTLQLRDPESGRPLWLY